MTKLGLHTNALILFQMNYKYKFVIFFLWHTYTTIITSFWIFSVIYTVSSYSWDQPWQRGSGGDFPLKQMKYLIISFFLHCTHNFVATQCLQKSAESGEPRCFYRNEMLCVHNSRSLRSSFFYFLFTRRCLYIMRQKWCIFFYCVDFKANIWRYAYLILISAWYFHVILI